MPDKPSTSEAAAAGSGLTLNGTSRNDRLVGGSGNDTLNGAGGADTLVGGLGDDIYYVDRATDAVVEAAGGGIDTVYASVSYVLPSDVEILYLTGRKALDGMGNAIDNLICGNDLANALAGGDGDDTLTGAAGNDTLDGGNGSDIAVFSRNYLDYALTWWGAELQVAALAGSDGTDRLKGIEFLRFADVTITVQANAAPVALADTVSGGEDAAVTFDPRINDGDPDGDALSYPSVVTGPAHGSVTINPDGSLTYAPVANYSGSDSLVYQITDGRGGTATATVTIAVAPMQDAPIANGDAVATSEDAVATGNVLANDSDADGEILTVTAVNGQTAGIGQAVTLPSGALLTLQANGSYSYDPRGAFNDLSDGQTGTDGFTYAVSDGAGGTATATVTVSIGGVSDGGAPEEPPYYVVDLLLGDAQRWNHPGDPGTPATVTFTFLDDVPAYYGSGDWAYSAFRTFTDQQRQATLDALSMIENYANIDFVAVAGAADAAITFGIADIPGYVGYSYYPGSTGIGGVAGDVWLDSNYAGTSFSPGSSQYMTLIHEIGHAIGLDHPSTLTGAENSRMHTVMSYTANPYSAAEAQTHMVFDIAAVQYLYGANMNGHSGDDVYTYAALYNKGMTLWDAGGIDTLDLTSATSRLLLDLRPGEHSTVAPTGAYNLAIAYGTTIENASGGSGNDTLIGNEADNRLAGGRGNDVMTGGAGGDRFVFASGFGLDRITDFQRGQDVLDLSATGATYSNLIIAVSGSDSTVTYGTSSITVAGVAQLDTSDFVFA